MKLGIAIDLIQCKEGQELVIKTTNSLPACIKQENVEKQAQKQIFPQTEARPYYYSVVAWMYAEAHPCLSGIGVFALRRARLVYKSQLQ